MSWTLLVPLKPRGLRKQRLAASFDPGQRDRLADAMFDHVAGILAGMPGVMPVLVSAEPQAGWTGAWHPDRGGGLNAALTAAWEDCGTARVAVLHADLPMLAAADVAALLAAAEEAGCAIAPDRTGTGTNALAIADGRRFAPAFGAGSLVRHIAGAGSDHVLVRRRGLALDLDTIDDWAELAEERRQELMGRAT